MKASSPVSDTKTNEDESEAMNANSPPFKVDSAFVLMSGIVSLLAAFLFRRDDRIQKLSSLAIDPQGSDVIRYAIWVMAATGSLSLALYLLRRRRNTISFNKYVGALAGLLCVNFIVGLVLTIYKKQARSGLADAMRLALAEARISVARFGIGFSISDAWDYIQMEMKCCGVDGYTDYMTDTWDRKQPVPVTCCVHTPGPSPRLDNEAQCQTDARLRLLDSVFLHTKGCHRSLTAWLSRRITMLTAILFLTICLQALAVLFLSWRGYTKHATRGERKQ